MCKIKNRDLLRLINDELCDTSVNGTSVNGTSVFAHKTVVIYGTRRVGKTTLVQQLLAQNSNKTVKYFSCEDVETRMSIETTNTEALKSIFQGYDIVVIDEAQAADKIGLTLKIIHDFIPEVQLIVTGSSSFDLSNKIGEPLVGRAFYYKLYPFSLRELNYDYIKMRSIIDHILRFGLYPTVVEKTEEKAKKELLDLTNGYLYKDILAIEGIRHSKVLLNLLIALALQIGNEVSYNELANKLGISANTVIKYVDLLEKCFIIFELTAFSRNLRNEVGRKSKKIYFYDLGVRNAIINAFAPLEMRADVGALWENFCIVELIKKANNNQQFSNNYFWRTYEQQEVDFIEEYDGVLHAYEFKYSPKAKVKPPKLFLETYQSEFTVIHKDNWYEKLVK
ncbi:ATPase [Alphaproteobacteria bacterium]|nr:ATPase [Alphaproteobacteria bacterium]